MTQTHKGLLAFSYSQWLLLAFSWSKLLLSRDSYAASSSAALFQCDCVSLKSLPKSCIQSSRIVYQNIRFFSLWEWNEISVCVYIYTHICMCICIYINIWNQEKSTVISAAWETVSGLYSCFIIKQLLICWLEENRERLKMRRGYFL